MYKIYLDGHLLHDTFIKDLKIYNPKVTLEQNGIGSFEFTMYPSHPLNNFIYPLKSIVTVYQRGDIIFRGRVLELEATTQNAKSIYCEGELGFLCDTIQYPYDYSGSVSGLFSQVINAHNEQVEEFKQFKVGIVNVIDKNDFIVRADTTYLSTWETINKKFIELLGGYIQVRHEEDGNYIDYLEDFTTLNSQHVTFGENMLSVKRTEENGDIGTVLIPFGAKLEDSEERLTIAEVNDGKIYIENEENIKKFSRVVKKATWDDVTVAENLKNKAIALLAEMGKQISTVEISAIDMASISEDIRNFRMYSKIQVTSDFHGINDYFVPMKMTISLFNPKNNKITLNGTVSTLTSSNTSNQVEIGKLIQSVQIVENSTNYSIPLELKKLENRINENKEQVTTKIEKIDLRIDGLNLRVNNLGSNMDKVSGDLDILSNAVADISKNDTDWIPLTLTDFKSYDETTTPEYRVKGNVVEIRGAISPLTEHIASNARETFASIPQGIAPSKPIYKLCQGSGKNTWLFTIRNDGKLQFSRYGASGYDTVPTTAWLVFDEVYVI